MGTSIQGTVQHPLSPSEQAEKEAAFEEFLAMRGSFRELYDRFGGVEAVIRDRHGLEPIDEVE